MKTILLTILFLAWASVAQAQFSASLTWQDNSTNEDGFILERNLNGGPYTVIASAIGANIISFTDSTLVQGNIVNKYCYRVKAFNSAGSSAYADTPTPRVTDCKIIAALVVTPNAPTGLTVSAISNQTLETSWANNAPGASTELARRSANLDEFAAVATLAPGKSVYRQMALPSRTTFCYRARAVQGEQVSEFSDLSCATTK